MVSAGETRRNLAALRELISGELGAAVYLIPPPPADQQRIVTNFAHEPLRWDAASLDEIAGVVRELDPNCIDIAARLRRRGLAGALEPDGVHLTPAGQRFVAETVVRQLAAA
jgi:lysophospholipase L1-like esterase